MVTVICRQHTKVGRFIATVRNRLNLAGDQHIKRMLMRTRRHVRVHTHIYIYIFCLCPHTCVSIFHCNVSVRHDWFRLQYKLYTCHMCACNEQVERACLACFNWPSLQAIFWCDNNIPCAFSISILNLSYQRTNQCICANPDFIYIYLFCKHIGDYRAFVALEVCFAHAVFDWNNREWVEIYWTADTNIVQQLAHHRNTQADTNAQRKSMRWWSGRTEKTCWPAND